MTNVKRLKTLIDYSGYKYTVLAYKLGMSRTTLWSRLNGFSEFTIDEQHDIARILHLTKTQRSFIFNEDSRENYI